MFFNSGPELYLCGIAEQVTNNSTALQCFFNFKQSFAGHKAIAYSLIPGLGVFALTNNYVDTIITLVECLTGALHAISNYCDRFVLQHFLCFGERELFTGYHVFFCSAEI